MVLNYFFIVVHFKCAMPDILTQMKFLKLEVVRLKEVKVTLEPKKSGFVQRSLEVKQTLLRPLT